MSNLYDQNTSLAPCGICVALIFITFWGNYLTNKIGACIFFIELNTGRVSFHFYPFQLTPNRHAAVCYLF